MDSFRMRALLVFSTLLVGISLGAGPDCKNGTPDTANPDICACEVNWTGDLCDTIVCENGGVPKKDDPTNCDCQPYWTGDKTTNNRCTEIVCTNGGYIETITTATGTKDVCHCPKGYYGIHCDAVKQSRPVDGVFNTKKSFNLYIHNELTDWYGMKALQRIKNQTREILVDYTYDQFNLFVSNRKAKPVDGEPTPDPEEGWDFQSFGTRDEFLDYLDASVPEKRTRIYTCAPTDISYNKLHTSLISKNIEDGTILMFTQYPPNTGQDDDLIQLKKYLRAFRIKLNVIIGADDILLDCNSKTNKNKKFAELTDLVHFSDGEIATFLIEDDDSPDELLPSFIRSSASPQSHYRVASTSCADPPDGAKFEFQTDPYPNTYYIAVRSDQDDPAVIGGSCSSGGEVVQVAFAEYKEFSLFSILSGAQQTCTLHVKTKGACLATVYSIGGEKGVDKFDIFHSFATSDAMDTDSIHSFQDDKYFLTMHVDIYSTPEEPSIYQIVEFGGEVIVNNDEVREVFRKNLTNRGSTFEYQSEDRFPCPAVGTSWIQLNLEGFNVDDKSVAVLNRIIHLNCEERKTTVVPPSGLIRMMDEVISDKPATTLVLMYSNQLPTPQFSRFILEGVDPDLVEKKFTDFGFLRFDAKDIMEFKPYTDFGKFRTAVYDNAPDSTITSLDTLKQHLEKLTSGTEKIRSDSLVSIAIQHSMTDPQVNTNQYASNLAELANLGSKLLFWGDIDTVTVSENDLESLEVYTRMAAISAGHVVLMDMDDFTETPDPTGDYPFYVSLALRDLYSFGPSQRLLSYSNLEWSQTSSQTSQSSPIGTLQIPEGADTVFLSLTLNVQNPVDIAPAFMLSIVLEGINDRIVLNIGDFKQYGSPGYVRSNLYTAKVPVVGGETYEGTFTVLAMTPFTGAHIRFWTERTEDDIIPTLTYADFDKTKTIQPDNYLGAALRVAGTEGAKMILRFLDEHGVEASLLNHNQNVTVVNGVAHFVPYFCDATQSTSLSNGMYTVELTYDTGFTYFRPMYCSNSTYKPNPDPACTNSNDGNYYCTESNPPFHRGPSRKLIDCSGVGEVVYSEDSDAENYYKCNCETGFDGKSCEMSSCAAGIKHLPEESDDEYRTLSYVLISPAGQDACSSLSAFYADDAKQIFNKEKPFEKIWQYTFSVYFTDGTAKTLYRGPNYDKFYSKFEMFTEPDFEDQLETFCGNEKNTQAIDFNDVFNLAVESVGRNSRGVVFFQAIQTFPDDLKHNQLKDAFASNELYQSIQAYQQHIYMVTPTMTADIISMTASSGGFAVRLQNDYSKEYTTSVNSFQNTFYEIVNSEVGWAGVATEAKTAAKKIWTIRKDAELFFTSSPDENGLLPTITITSVAATPYTYDKDDESDNSVTQHASIAADDSTPVNVSIAFTADQTYELFQVVILTKANPIRNALIGQSQANTDKHAAGATNSSEKAVHISFNQQLSEYYFEPSDNNWRQASRINCDYAQEFVAALYNPFKDIGVSVVDFTVSPTDDNNKPLNNTFFSLSVPLAVSESIDCVHGQFDEAGSYCVCDSANWSGPTCSQPDCGEKGTLNSHGDHCDCTQAEFGGLFCKDEKKTSFFEEE